MMIPLQLELGFGFNVGVREGFRFMITVKRVERVGAVERIEAEVGVGLSVGLDLLISFGVG